VVNKGESIVDGPVSPAMGYWYDRQDFRNQRDTWSEVNGRHRT